MRKALSEWVRAQIKDFNKSTKLRIKPFDSSVKNFRYKISNDECCINNYNLIYYHQSSFIVTRTKKRTIITNTSNGKKSESICHKNDTFNPWVGIAYAWAKYKGEKIPSFRKQLHLDAVPFGRIFEYEGIKYKKICKHPYDISSYICVNTSTFIPVNLIDTLFVLF